MRTGGRPSRARESAWQRRPACPAVRGGPIEPERVRPGYIYCSDRCRGSEPIATPNGLPGLARFPWVEHRDAQALEIADVPRDQGQLMRLGGRREERVHRAQAAA